ncbi:MAG: hypothetical protein KGJ13_12285 [Patescibacteria group bacterium]|nr:hypothetical protein [Patescibacteria group bacterium]
MLTKRQRDLLRYVADFEKRQGFCPTYEMMARGIGLKSKSGAHRLVTGLERRGFLRRIPRANQSIEILRQP